MADRLCYRCEDNGVVRDPDGFEPCPGCWSLCSTGCTATKLCERHLAHATGHAWIGGEMQRAIRDSKRE